MYYELNGFLRKESYIRIVIYCLLILITVVELKRKIIKRKGHTDIVKQEV